MMKKLLIQMKGKQEEVTMIFKTLVIRTCFLLACSILLPTAVALSQDYCEGNFDYDQDQDGSDAFQFKTDFGRSVFTNPCPPDGPAPVERTGQTISDFYCDDGYLQKGVAWPNPRFTDNGNGTVTDTLTGLVWLKDASCLGVRTWVQAVSDASLLTAGYCGLTDNSWYYDWRLPNVKELQSLIDFGQYAPALPSGHPFVNVQHNPALYWSSTRIGDSAWYVEMDSGYVFWDFKYNSHYAWPVRGGH